MPSRKITVKTSEVLFERKEFQQKGLDLPHVSLTKEGVVPKSERYERDFLVKDEEKDYKVTRIGDLCYNPANLKFGVITLNEKYNGIFSPIYVTFEINKKLMTNLYAKYFFLRHNFVGRLMRYQQGTVYERMSVSPVDFVRDDITIHNLSEQEKIGAFLSAIDRLIDGESKKETLLSNNYKRLIGLIFPNNNSIANLPKLRFPTYKSPWRTLRFETIGSLKKGKLLGKSDLSELGKPCILYGELYTIYSKSPIIDEVFSKTNVNKDQLLIGNKFDVLIPSSGETKEDISSAVCLNVSNTLIGGDLNLIRPTKEIRGGFLAYLIRGPLKNKIAKLAQGNSVVHLNYPQLKKIVFTAPEIVEQDHIVNLLYKYDKLKQLIHQRTQSYKRLKKAFVQKLFANKEGNL